MKKTIAIITACLVLSGCATVRPLTPEEQEKARQSEICAREAFLTPDRSFSYSYLDFCVRDFEHHDKAFAKLLKKGDPLPMCQYEARLDIERNPLVSKEIKRRKINCKEIFKKEEARARKEYLEQEKRRANPALYYCIDNGFKSGTQAMATCMAGWNEQQLQQQQMQAQQQQYEQERNAQALRNFAEIMRQNTPTQTNCQTFGNNTNCTSW